MKKITMKNTKVIKDLSQFSFQELDELSEAIQSGNIDRIYLNGVPISFPILTSLYLNRTEWKNLPYEYPEFHNIIQDNFEDILRMVFGIGCLPDEIFSMGNGIYEFGEDNWCLLAYPEKTIEKTLLDDSIKNAVILAQGFLVVSRCSLVELLGSENSLLKNDGYFENILPKFSYMQFVHYYLNWVISNDFISDGEKYIITHYNFDEVA
nr:hypothetical protein [Algoriphagus sp.]